MDIKQNLVSENELLKSKKQRSSDYIFKKVEPELVDKYLKLNWEIDRELKKTFSIKKKKSFDVIFENDIWLMFYNLGFKTMNKDRDFQVPYSKDGKLTHQINVCAIDDETIILVDCKSSIKRVRKKDFKTDIEAIHGKSIGIRKTFKKLYPKHKIKFVIATKNYDVCNEDKKRMEEFDIAYFDEEKIEYYNELTKHLGSSSRYQLLGNLFKGQKIQGIDNIVPAISGTMGGHKYYSFSIEPEIILKLGYVLHRNDSNKDSMPTYQRIIKKNRLRQIQNFIDNGGYFPNSIIVSINTGTKSLKFEPAKQNKNISKSKIGLLYLPQQYQSIYIIDGQHRLYGYSESNYKSTNTIPVVAFENLDKEEQVQIFMDINENQKSVPKNLRNTLEEDLNYYSENNNLNRKALGLKIARILGEDNNSPLYDMIIIGENVKSDTRFITLETISNAVQKSDFLSRFDNKNSLTKYGTFDKGKNDITFKLLYPFLFQCLEFLINETKEKVVNRSMISNPGIFSIIKICNDIINYLVYNDVINPIDDNIDKTISYSKIYLKYIADYWNSMSEEEYNDLKSRYGEGGKNRYWRTFQKIINQKESDFCPDGMKKYWDENSLDNYLNAQKIIAEIERYLNYDVKNILEKEYGKYWMKKGLPKKIFLEINQMASDKNYDADDLEEEVDPWNCLYLIHYKDIVSNQWKLFEELYTWPGTEKNNKKDKIAWFNQLNKIRNKCSHNHMASSSDVDFLNELRKWLIK